MLAVLFNVLPAVQTPLGALKLTVRVAGTLALGTVQVTKLPPVQAPLHVNEPAEATKPTPDTPVGKVSVTTKLVPLINAVLVALRLMR